MSFLRVVFVALSLLLTLSSSCIPTQQPEDTTTTTTTSTTTTPPKCLSGWTTFYRTGYIWCMKVYVGPVNQASAKAECTAMNSAAVPSGFQNKAEIYTMMAIANAIQANTALIIGARRTVACEYSLLTATCTTTNSFYWTDGHTNGIDGWNWSAGNPNNGYDFTQWNVVVSSSTGEMDDVADATKGGVVCGMLAT